MLSDDEIVSRISEHEVEDGYSPSLLNEDEVRALAVPRNDTDAQSEHDHDAFQAMQTSAVASRQQEAEVLSSDEELPDDWIIDLQRIAGQFARSCDA